MHIHQAGNQPGAFYVNPLGAVRNVHAAGSADCCNSLPFNNYNGVLYRRLSFQVNHRAADNGGAGSCVSSLNGNCKKKSGIQY